MRVFNHLSSLVVQWHLLPGLALEIESPYLHFAKKKKKKTTTTTSKIKVQKGHIVTLLQFDSLMNLSVIDNIKDQIDTND
jgi:hypothetical protein